MTRSRHDRWICAATIMMSTAACGGTAQQSTLRADQRVAGPDSTAEPAELEPIGDMTVASSAGPNSEPFVLETTLNARTWQNGHFVTRANLRSGDTVKSGDHLHASVRTSKDAYLYLAYCSQLPDGSRAQSLTVYPNKGPMRLTASRPGIIPDPNEHVLVLDKVTGAEAIYLIFSRTELSDADTALADAIAAARQGRKDQDCKQSLQGSGAGRGKISQRRSISSGAGSAGRAKAAPRPRPDFVRGELERGAYIAPAGGAHAGVEADADGIVVLRYELVHQ